MSLSSSIKLPTRIVIKDIISSRYEDNARPLSWDERKDGTDVVTTSDNQNIKLWSSGEQSPPKKGWILLLEGGDAEVGYQWTLYGIPKGSSLGSSPAI